VELSTRTDQEHRAVTVEQAALTSTRRRPHLRGAGAWVANHPGVIVVALALGVAVWAVVGSRLVFPYLSDDHDEGLYLLQAHALAEGHLFPPAPRPPEAFVPWLSVHSDGKYVLKYAPVHASVLAVGVWLGSVRWALGLLAAAVVVMSYVLAKEVLGDRRVAAVATAFLALSPLFVLQTATFLPYCTSLLLLEAFIFTLLRGTRSQRRPLLAASGFILGVAFFARPLDALTFAAPLGIYFVLSQRHDRAKLVRNSMALALGVAPPLLAMAAYYQAATGSPFRSPFNLLEPKDTIGFGVRKLLPYHPDLIFTPSLGWYGVGRHILLTSFWVFGGLVLIGLFLACVLRGRLSGSQPWLLLAAFTFSCGYLFFWGTYGMSLRGSLTGFMGPFYFLPILLPLTFLAAKSFAGVWERDRAVAILAFVSMLGVSGYVFHKAIQVNLRLTEDNRRLYSGVASAQLDRSLVFVPAMWGPHLLHPFSVLQNAPDHDGPTVYALDRGDGENLLLLEDFPGRTLHRLRVHGHYRALPPDRGLTSSLEPLSVVEQEALRTRVVLRNPTAEPYLVLSVARAGRKDSFVLDTDSSSAKRYEASMAISPDSVEVVGPVESHSVEQSEPDRSLVVSVSVGAGEGQPLRTLYERRLAYSIQTRSLKVLLPGSVSVNELPEEPLPDLTVSRSGQGD
jgi:hypothetical protein